MKITISGWTFAPKRREKNADRKLGKRDILVFRTDTISTLNSFKGAGKWQGEEGEEEEREKGGEEKEELESERAAADGRYGSIIQADYDGAQVSVRMKNVCNEREEGGGGEGEADKKDNSRNPLQPKKSKSTADELEEILEKTRKESKNKSEWKSSRESSQRHGRTDGRTDERRRRRRSREMALAASTRHRLRYMADEEMERKAEEMEFLSPSEARKKRKQSSIKIQRQKKRQI